MRDIIQDASFKYGGFVLLILQQVLCALVVWWVRLTIPKSSQYIPSCMVAAAEFGKLILNLFLLYTNTSKESFLKFLQLKVSKCTSADSYVLISSFFYSIQNNLLAEASGRLDPLTFQVIYQLKLIFTVIFSRIFLGTEVSAMQFVAILMLFLGIIIVSLNSAEDSTRSDSTNTVFYGSICVGIASLTSGIAGVVTEYNVKTNGSCDASFSQPSQLWIYSFQVSMYGFLFSMGICLQDIHKIRRLGFFHGFNNPLSMLALFLYICGGPLVVVVLKYMDNIWKGFASAIALIIQAIIQSYIKNKLPGTRRNVGFDLLAGLTMVVVSISFYNIAAYKSKALD